jgi:hypothetical protein
MIFTLNNISRSIFHFHFLIRDRISGFLNERKLTNRLPDREAYDLNSRDHDNHQNPPQ